MPAYFLPADILLPDFGVVNGAWGQPPVRFA